MEKKDMKSDNVNPCPEFPHFGAWYPDARCIDGFLWDLDSDEDGLFTHGGDDPCPFCNQESYIEWMLDEENGITRQMIISYIEKIKEQYS